MTSVLIAEDDAMIAEHLQEMLIEARFDVCGIAATVETAIALGIAHEPELAILDLRLAGGGVGTEVAAALRSHARIGILYATGNVAHPLLEDAEDAACIAKPYSSQGIIAALRIVLAMTHDGVPPPPALPRGMRLLQAPLLHAAPPIVSSATPRHRPDTHRPDTHRPDTHRPDSHGSESRLSDHPAVAHR